MVDDRLNRAVNELSKFFQLHSLDELLDRNSRQDSGAIQGQAAQSEGQNEDNEDMRFIAKIKSLIVQTQTGALLSKDLVKNLRLLKDEFGGSDQLLKDNVRIYFDDDAKKVFDTKKTVIDVIGGNTLINENSRRPDKDNTSVSIIQIFTARINPSNKNTNAVSIFMNSIPTLEWTRSVPFLDIEFQLARPQTINGRVGGLSALKFLEGAASTKNLGNADSAMANALTINRFESESGIAPSERPGSSGMELFTMPQTLVNPEPGSDQALRAVPILDPFRPFASIKSFDVSVVPAPGIMSYKTGKLSFVLHDRSRLHEIADFIKPDQYSKTEIMIEYGWSHPSGEFDNNVWGDFINNLRTKEKYYVKNNTVSFKGNGEVDITLELYTKGSIDFYNRSISEGEEVEEAQKFIEQLQERISDLRNRVFKQDQKFVKEIRGEQILQSASDSNAQLSLTPELRKELKKTLSSLGKGGSGDDGKELRQLLINLYGKNGTGGKAKKKLDSISAAINEKMQKIVSRTDQKTDDPFLFAPDGQDNKDISSNYVSLAKLMLLFIVEPLAATHKFDDIQLLFYSFNDHAGLVQSNNIGAFKIDIKEFQAKYKKVALSRSGSANLNLRDFIHFLVNNFMEDISSINYGMREIYDYEADHETGSRITPKRKYRDTSILNSKIEKIMKTQALIPDGVFKMPHIDCYIECVPADVTEVGENQHNTDQKTILRIHVFDKVASSYSTYGELLSAKVDKHISTLGDRPFVEKGSTDRNAINKAIEDSSSILRRAKANKLIELIPGSEGKETVYRVVGGQTQLSEFLKNSMPYFLFGANNTAIKHAGLKSMTDNKLSTINMLRSGKAGPLSPSGVGEGGLPMQVLPAQMDMSIFGCPIIEYAQQFFADFQTGTTVDNIYTVTKIDHTFTPGKFETKMGMVPLDAFGKYRSVIQKVGASIKILGEYNDGEIQKPQEETKDDDDNSPN